MNSRQAWLYLAERFEIAASLGLLATPTIGLGLVKAALPLADLLRGSSDIFFSITSGDVVRQLSRDSITLLIAAAEAIDPPESKNWRTLGICGGIQHLQNAGLISERTMDKMEHQLRALFGVNDKARGERRYRAGYWWSEGDKGATPRAIACQILALMAESDHPPKVPRGSW